MLALQRRFIIGCALLLAAQNAAAQGTWYWPPPEVNVSPARRATYLDVIFVTVGGEWPDTCAPSEIAHEINAQSREVLLTLTAHGVACGDAITPWSLASELGMLPGGTYALRAQLKSEAFGMMGPDFLRLFFVYGPGDVNGDGDVDLTDLNNVRNDFGCGPPRPCVGDAPPFDGDTDLDDLNAVRNAFGPRRAAAVPEPTGVILVVIGALLLVVAIRFAAARNLCRPSRGGVRNLWAGSSLLGLIAPGYMTPPRGGGRFGQSAPQGQGNVA